MAMNIRGLCKLNIGLVSNIFRKTNFANVGVRFLYTEKSLGVTAYENTRYIFHNQFLSIEDTFRSKMADVCSKDDAIVFTEDLKAMLHLAQKNESDLNLLFKMIEKYVATSATVKLSTYTFGPVVMRMFYYLNEPTLALSAFNNPLFDDFFKQKSSFQVLLSLLYKHEMYSEIRDVFSKVMSMENLHYKPIDSTTILFASCYKDNTPEAYEYALNHWKQYVAVTKKSMMNRPLALLAALAIKQNEPGVAMEILSSAEWPTFITIRCLKVLAYVKLQKYVHIIPLLKQTLEMDTTATKKHTYFADVINDLENALKDEENRSETTELMNLISSLKREDRLTTDSTLEETLLKPIEFTIKNANMRQREQQRGRGEQRLFRYRDNSRIGLRNYL